MSVVVAHLSTTTGHVALVEAARQAVLRGTSLTIIHITDVVDHDVSAAHHAGVTHDIGTVFSQVGITGLEWELKLAVASDDTEDTSHTILTLADEAHAELLVIGARRRSPLGKAFLGSVTQDIILKAERPVLVVKAPRERPE